MRSSFLLLAVSSIGCGTTPVTPDGGGDAGDAGIVDASMVAWRLTPGAGSVRMIESQSTDGIVFSGYGTDWADEAGAPFTVELRIVEDASVLWSLHALTRSAAPDPSGWHLVGMAGTSATFPAAQPPGSDSEFVAMTNFGPHTISVLYLPPLASGNVELEGVASKNNWVWVRGVTAGGTADLDGGSMDAGAVDGSPTSFVARYFGATDFIGATFLPMRVTAIASDAFGVWGGASDGTSLHLFTITEANVKTDLRTFTVTSTDGTPAGFDDLVAAPTTSDGSTGGVVGSFINRPTVSVDFGLPPPGSGGTRVVRFDAAGAPLWSAVLGDPASTDDANIRRRLRLYCLELDTTGCSRAHIAVLGTGQGRSALFLLDTDGALLETWHAPAGDVILDFDLIGGTIVAGTNGSNALIERITNFP